MTIDILICSKDKGVVRIIDVLQEPQPGVRYIVSYQYTDERYLDLIPEELAERDDVSIHTYNGQGLSANRNLAMEKATADLILFADDDSRLDPDATQRIISVFEAHPDLDIAFFQASTYRGKQLKPYPKEETELNGMPDAYVVSALEMVCRRERVVRTLRFDERFGLGTQYLTCGEEEIWMEDARRRGMKMRYFPIKIVETSTLLKTSRIHSDAGVQRSYGAITYYKRGLRAWPHCLRYAWKCSREGDCRFWPIMKHFSEGIRYMRNTD